jgi:hypothetical protein
MNHLAHQNKERKNLMHYRNGREAKNGDPVIQLQIGGGIAQIVSVGILHHATPGNSYCNGQIAPTHTMPSAACLCDCLHMDDVAEILKEKGLDVRPKGM